MSYELIMEYYQQAQDILANNVFQDYGIIGLFLNSLLSATAIPVPTEILTSALLIGGESVFLVGIALVVGSTIGGLLNYFIGFGGNKLFNKLGRNIFCSMDSCNWRFDFNFCGCKENEIYQVHCIYGLR